MAEETDKEWAFQEEPTLLELSQNALTRVSETGQVIDLTCDWCGTGFEGEWKYPSYAGARPYLTRSTFMPHIHSAFPKQKFHLPCIEAAINKFVRDKQTPKDPNRYYWLNTNNPYPTVTYTPTWTTNSSGT
jgi:hypothetical protein